MLARFSKPLAVSCQGSAFIENMNGRWKYAGSHK
jgi:hypothetical protein